MAGVLAYIKIRGAFSGPLFIVIDQHQIAAAIADMGYNTNSFRIGAATIVKEVEISDVHIKMLGSWKSDAYQLYVCTPRDKLSKQLAITASSGANK